MTDIENSFGIGTNAASRDDAIDSNAAMVELHQYNQLGSRLIRSGIDCSGELSIARIEGQEEKWGEAVS